MDALALLPKDLFAEEVAFVTGGGSGINFAIARAFARLGAKVVICGRTAATLDAAAEQIRALGGTVRIQAADVRDADALQVAFDEVRSAWGPVRHLVCGAAGNFVAPAEQMSPKGFRTVVDIDLIGSFNTARVAFDQLRETGGTVLFISGGQSFVPFMYQAHVAAAKAGVDMLMRTLALEWGRHGIRLNGLVPGPIAGTEGMARLTPKDKPDFWTDMVPMGRMGQPDEIAQMAVVLASPLGSYVNGALLTVDGGQNLTGSSRFNDSVGEMLVLR